MQLEPDPLEVPDALLSGLVWSREPDTEDVLNQQAVQLMATFAVVMVGQLAGRNGRDPELAGIMARWGEHSRAHTTDLVETLRRAERRYRCSDVHEALHDVIADTMELVQAGWSEPRSMARLVVSFAVVYTVHRTHCGAGQSDQLMARLHDELLADLGPARNIGPCRAGTFATAGRCHTGGASLRLEAGKLTNLTMRLRVYVLQ
jgi:hypothetical protein